MEKQQAAAFLGVSIRSLERYTQQGKLSVTYERGGTGNIATYDQAELERFRQVMMTSVTRPAIGAPTIAEASNTELVTVKNSVEVAAQLLALLNALGHERRQNNPTVPIEAKLLLKLNEAQALTGLSRECIREAITSEQLKASKIGRAWRIKRADLTTFITQLDPNQLSRIENKE